MLYGSNVSGLALSAAAEVVVSGTILILALLALAGGLFWARRAWLKPRPKDDLSALAGFSIEHLEEMREAGQISKEEFSRLRRMALGLEEAAQSVDNGDNSVSPHGQDDDGKQGPLEA